MTQWDRQLLRAQQGRELWESLVEEFGKQAVFFLCCDRELQEQVRCLLPVFLEKKGYETGVMLTLEPEYSEKNSPKNSSKNVLAGESSSVVWKTVTEEEQECLLCCYEMYQFTSKLRVLSWERPCGTHLASLKEKYSTQTIIETCVLF